MAGEVDSRASAWKENSSAARRMTSAGYGFLTLLELRICGTRGIVAGLNCD